MELVALPAIGYDACPPSFKALRPELAGRDVEFKALEGEVKVDRKKRRIDLFIANFKSVDQGSDLIVKGAAARTIAEDLPRGLIKLFLGHAEPLGPADVLEEQQEGLFMSGKVTDHPDFDRKLAQVEDRTYGHGSLGFSVRKSETVAAADLQGKFGVDAAGHDPVRVIHDMRVWEGSPVIWPMHEAVKVVRVKGSAMESKGLWELADVVAAMARIRSLTSADWAALSDEEVVVALDLVDQMASTEKSMRLGLEVRETKSRPPADFDIESLLATAKDFSLTS